MALFLLYYPAEALFEYCFSPEGAPPGPLLQASMRQRWGCCSSPGPASASSSSVPLRPRHRRPTGSTQATNRQALVTVALGAFALGLCFT